MVIKVHGHLKELVNSTTLRRANTSPVYTEGVTNSSGTEGLINKQINRSGILAIVPRSVLQLGVGPGNYYSWTTKVDHLRISPLP